MQIKTDKKNASPVVWIIIAVMVIALLALIVFYAYQEDPAERLPTDRKGNETSKIIYIHEV